MSRIFSKSFTRQVGGIPPPPALGSDLLPAHVAGAELLENAIKLPAWTAGCEAVSAVAVGVTAPVAGSVDVAVYVGDEPTNTWLLAGREVVPVGEIRRVPVPSGPGTTGITAIVIASPSVSPAGTYRILFTGDQAARPIPEGTPVAVTGPLTVTLPNPLPVSTTQLPPAPGPDGGVLVEGIFPVSALRYHDVGVSGQIKGAPGRLWTFYAYRSSSGAANTWIQIFDRIAAGGAIIESLCLPPFGQGQAVITIPGDYAVAISWGVSSSPTAFVATTVSASVFSRYQ